MVLFVELIGLLFWWVMAILILCELKRVLLAADSNVDRSIGYPGLFVSSNVLGALNLLNAAQAHYQSSPAQRA